MNNKEKIDPILWLLLGGMITFSVILFVVEYSYKDDREIFQLFAGLLTSFSGAFFLRVKPKEPSQPSDKIEHPVKVETNTVVESGPKGEAEK